MTDEAKDPRVDDATKPAQNPEGELSEKPGPEERQRGHTVSGEEAEAAGRRAMASEPVTRQDVIDQAAYKDNSVDAGQQAAEAEKER